MKNINGSTLEALNRQQSRYARSLIEASLDPLFTINPEGKITDMNNASIGITKLPREKLIGSDFFGYFTEPEKAREICKQIFAEGFVADFPLTISNGRLTDVLFNGSVYKDEYGKVLGVVVVARDVTDTKRIESELIESKVNAELATRVAEDAQIKAEKATTIAEKATMIAEDAVKSKQQFLSNMSHEIRTPMNAIIGFTKVLLKTELSFKQREYLTSIKISGDALTLLINDILDLAKVDAGKMIFEQIPFKMATSISAMIHVFETKIQEKNLLLTKKYDNRIPAVIVGDPLRLHQIILNLVSNAVKFTTEGEIVVSVQLLKEDAETVTIEFAISDTGIGIEEKKIEHIFENFQQASSDTARLYGGTGLGLAIAKQLVETQGGTITVKSIFKKGSTFSFVLPFRKTDAEAGFEAEPMKLDPELKNIRVLVVEDIVLNQLLMKTLLDDFGFSHDIATNGKIAIRMLQEKSYDIVLMDLQMPEMNGFDAARNIRANLKLQIPIIALTADVTTADLQKCKLVGMNDYISKPVDERLLYNKIVDLLKKPAKEHEIGSSVKEKDVVSLVQGNSKVTNLGYLFERTKGNSELMLEMISLFLQQTPDLIGKIKISLEDNDLEGLKSSAHKLIPSFSIMGIHKDYENLAKKLQEYARTNKHTDDLKDLVCAIEIVCTQACEELKGEYDIINKKKQDDE